MGHQAQIQVSTLTEIQLMPLINASVMAASELATSRLLDLRIRKDEDYWRKLGEHEKLLGESLMGNFK